MSVKKIIGGTFEFAGETAKKSAQVVPDVLGGMLEQAVKGGQQTAAQKQQAAKQMQQKTTDFKKKDEEELKKARESLAQLRRMQSQFAPKKQLEQRPYEAKIQEEEKKKAEEVEAQKTKPLVIPTSVQARGMLGKKKAKGSEGMVKDTRVG